MNNLHTKHQRIRARGKATLRVVRSHPLFLYNGITFRVVRMGKPCCKCRLKLVIRGKGVDVGIGDVL